MFTTDGFDYINLMDKAADASWKRENVLANNIANVDTPYFKREDVDFESVLARELGREESRYGEMGKSLGRDTMQFGPLSRRVRALNGDLSSLDVSPYTDERNYSYRLDHNNVDVDTENVELASEQLRYQLITTSINEEFERMKVVFK